MAAGRSGGMNMDKRKIKMPGAMRKEAKELLEHFAIVDVKRTREEVDMNEAAERLIRDIKNMPMIGFSYKELYIILRFLVELNSQGKEAKMAHYIRNEEEEFLCDLLASGIVRELDRYAEDAVTNVLNGIEITIREVNTDAVQR